MINGKSVLGMIPARGGSRRVPHKNITLYRGKPLIQWAMEHACASQYIDRWVVSTDADEIAIHAGENVLRRPAYLATDRATTESVLVHALYALPEEYALAVILQPTSPNRSVEDIDRCIEIAAMYTMGLHGCVSYNEYGKRNGAVYVVDVPHFLGTLSLDAAQHYEMPNERSLDLDNFWDFTQ